MRARTAEAKTQKTQSLTSSSPFLYLGVELTMDLCGKHQHRRMANNLIKKLKALKSSFATPRHTLAIIRTAIIPSLAYAFPVTPCSPAELDKLDTLIGTTAKDTFRLWRSTPAAMVREVHVLA